MDTNELRIEDVLESLPSELRSELTGIYGNTLVQENFTPIGSNTETANTEQAMPMAPINQVFEDTADETSEVNIAQRNISIELLPTLPDIVDSISTNIAAPAFFTDVNEETLRFNGAEWFDKVQKISVTLLGAGGISTWVGILLGKLGIFQIHIYDPDRYERVNMAGQFCFRDDLNKLKVDALGSIIRNTGSCRFIGTYSRKWRSDRDGIHKVTIVGVDNMLTRKEAFKAWQEHYGDLEDALFIDGRLAAEMYQLYTIKGRDLVAQERYLAEWFSDEEADELVCSFKQTAFMGAALGAKIIEHLVNFYTPQDAAPRLVPFYIEHTPYKDTIVKFAYNG